MATLTIEQRLRDVIVEQLGCDETEVTPAATLESLHADSLDTVELCMGIEQEFGVTVGDVEEEQIAALPFEGLVDWVSKKIYRVGL